MEKDYTGFNLGIFLYSFLADLISIGHPVTGYKT